MIMLALYILAFFVIAAVLFIGLGFWLGILKGIISAPCWIYASIYRYRLNNSGYEVDSKNFPSGKILRKFYSRVLTLRRPLLP